EIRYMLEMDGKEVTLHVLSKEFGGRSRVQLALQELARTEPGALLVDVGKTLDEEDDERNKRTLDALHQAGTELMAVGWEEIKAWKKLLEPYSQKFKDVHHIELLSANLYDGPAKTGRRPFRPFAVVERGGLKIAVIGVTSTYAQEGIEKLRPF